ncbi:hypothetical protein [Fischerella thermalis]|uniref:hypothetical protein n=1 Tax=Fischerella thermalis TaxID=372787 RepID=UPI0021553DCA|nr:hypothetical protein [Fischerella thermalis]
MRSLVLFVFVVLPGVTFSSISLYYLLPEWTTPDAAHKNYQQKKTDTESIALLKELEFC